MKLKEIHRVLAFHQAPWLKPFLDFNMAQRAAATSELAKDFRIAQQRLLWKNDGECP